MLSFPFQLFKIRNQEKNVIHLSTYQTVAHILALILPLSFVSSKIILLQMSLKCCLIYIYLYIYTYIYMGFKRVLLTYINL